MPELASIEVVLFLQSVDLFRYCKAEEILRLAAIAHERPFAAEETIYNTNDPADSLHCVVRGRVRLERPGREAGEINPLQTFGEEEILSGRLRAGRTSAAIETLTLAIEADDLFDLLANNVEIVKALFRQLLSRP